MKKIIISLLATLSLALVLVVAPQPAHAGVLDDVLGWLKGTAPKAADAGQVLVTLDPASPLQGLIQISQSAQTDNVLLAKYDLKSQAVVGTLRAIRIGVHTARVPVESLFGDIKLNINGHTYSADSITTGANSIATFVNMNEVLPADTTVIASVYGKVNQDTNGTTLTGATASTTILASGVAGNPANNPVVEDASHSSLSVANANLTTNSLVFASGQAVISGLSTSVNSYIQGNIGGTFVTTGANVSYTFTLTAGNNTIFISADPNIALGTSSTGFYTHGAAWLPQYGMTANPGSISGDSRVTSPGGYYVIPAGSSRTFTYSGVEDWRFTQVSLKVFQINEIRYGQSANALTASRINNNLTALKLTLTGGTGETGGGVATSTPTLSGLSAFSTGTVQGNIGGVTYTTSANVLYTFTMIAGNNTLYISRDPHVAFATSSTGFATLNSTVLYDVIANPGTISGDRANTGTTYGYYVIPAGSSRTFTSNGSMNFVGSPLSIKSLQIDAIRYGFSSNAVSSNVYSSGLAPLNVSLMGGVDTGGGTATTTSPVTVLSPNGGEVLRPLATNIVSWSGGQDHVAIGVVDSRFERDGGAPLGWIKLASVSTVNNSTIWNGYTVTPTQGNSPGAVVLLKSLSPGPYKIIAMSSNSAGNYCSNSPSCNYDISNAYFTVQEATTTATTTPTVTVLSPNGGETFQMGSTLPVKWKYTGTGTVDLYLISADNSSCYVGKGNLTAGTISFSLVNNYTCPNATTKHLVAGKYRMRVVVEDPTSISSTLAGDFSDALFTIAGPTIAPSPTTDAKPVPVIVPVAPLLKAPAASAIPLSATCYASPSGPHLNDTVTWRVVVSGGTFSDTYSWSGDVTGDTYNPSTFYGTIGSKTATVAVTSGKGSTSASCSVYVYDTPTMIAPVSTPAPSQSSSSPSPSSSSGGSSASPSSSGATSMAPSHSLMANLFYSIGDILDKVF